MQRSDIISKLKEGTVYITFLKADGATRDMKATLSESIAQYSSCDKRYTFVKSDTYSLSHDGANFIYNS